MTRKEPANNLPYVVREPTVIVPSTETWTAGGVKISKYYAGQIGVAVSERGVDISNHGQRPCRVSLVLQEAEIQIINISIGAYDRHVFNPGATQGAVFIRDGSCVYGVPLAYTEPTP